MQESAEIPGTKTEHTKTSSIIILKQITKLLYLFILKKSKSKITQGINKYRKQTRTESQTSKTKNAKTKIKNSMDKFISRLEKAIKISKLEEKTKEYKEQERTESLTYDSWKYQKINEGRGPI